MPSYIPGSPWLARCSLVTVENKDAFLAVFQKRRERPGGGRVFRATADHGGIGPGAPSRGRAFHAHLGAKAYSLQQKIVQHRLDILNAGGDEMEGSCML